MLVKLLSFWKGKLFVLVLLGFAATDFIITITLSAADATAHIDENPYWPDAWHGQEVLVTLLLITALGAVYRVLRVEGSSSVPSALASLLLWIQQETHRRPHIYFEWTEGNPVTNFARYLIFGQGEVAPVTR
ncbi:MAG TPA: hypothetical protein VN408_23090 [Actinoplanes sp.]|nr:hypothetical protein [Actinoplanes sp.]